MNISRTTTIKKALLGSTLAVPFLLAGCGQTQSDTLVLRVANCEEYIDEGDWEEDEAIELDDGTVIFSENALVDDFELWYEETYGRKVEVEYSTYGTNEELYNQMSLGSKFDLVCPSEYMIMKLMSENRLQAFSDAFQDASDQDNYYVRGLSPYIASIFDSLTINDEPISRYAAGYMWGTLGFIYDPEQISAEEMTHWSILLDPAYEKRITMKDSIRDSYFAALGILQEDELLSEDFLSSDDYLTDLAEAMNDTSEDTVDAVEDVLTDMRHNVYAMEVDSAKADIVAGKVAAGMQWSGDAVFSMDEAEKDDVYLSYACPSEATNLWFDGWVMMADAIAENPETQQVAEAFLNYISRPDNVVRNMYYIGYTSAISGGDDDLIYRYLEYNYGAEEGDDDTVLYPLGYFFAGRDQADDEDYMLLTSSEQLHRQLFAQYPTVDVIDHCAVMRYFDTDANRRISQMWTNVRCFTMEDLF